MFFDNENRILMGLKQYGFKRHPNVKNYMQKIYNERICSVMYNEEENLFVFDYFFKNEMDDDDADIFFPNIVKKVDDLQNELNSDQMGLDFIEGYIRKKYTNTIDTLKLNKLAMMFFDMVEQEIKIMNKFDILY